MRVRIMALCCSKSDYFACHLCVMAVYQPLPEAILNSAFGYNRGY